MVRWRERPPALLVLVLLAAAPALAESETLPCDVWLHEERLDLEDAELQVTLARSRVEAFGKIVELYQGLWDAEAIDRMTYLRARYDHDSARLTMQRADLILARQRALLDHVRALCEQGAEASHDAREALDRYQRANCDQQAKAIEIADVDLEFDREFLASVRALRKAEVATRAEIILAELEVRLDEQRRADATRRAAACRERLGPQGSERP